LIVAEALAMVSGKGLLGVISDECLRVWVWNLDDPREETKRKIQAAGLHYDLNPGDIGDRLMVDSGRNQKLVIANTSRTGTVIAHPVVDSLVEEMIKYRIDVLVIDPFVSCHDQPQNRFVGRRAAGRYLSTLALPRDGSFSDARSKPTAHR
jgi:RecA-family ATPase